jgi:hypothetical protein
MVSNLLTFHRLVSSDVPYPHFVAPQCFNPVLAEKLLEWFEEEAAWKIHKVQDFYEVYDLDLVSTPFPAQLSLMRGDALYLEVRNALERHFKTNLCDSVHVLVQMMTKGQTIRVHNDWSPEGPTHRFIVQLNQGWTTAQGGLFMILQKPDDTPSNHTPQLCLPTHRCGIGFEISERSYHAVTPVTAGNRYSIVFSYRIKSGSQGSE